MPIFRKNNINILNRLEYKYWSTAKMSLYSELFKIEAKYLRFLKPHGTINTIPKGVPMLVYYDNYTIHQIITKIRDDLWLTSIYGAVKILGFRELTFISNYLLEDYDTMDQEDKTYIDGLVNDIDKVLETIDLDDKVAYVWSKH